MAGRVRRAPDGTPLVGWSVWLHPLDDERFGGNASRAGLPKPAYFRKRCVEEETPRKASMPTLDRKAMSQAVAALDLALERLAGAQAPEAVLDECREGIQAIVRALGFRR